MIAIQMTPHVPHLCHQQQSDSSTPSNSSEISDQHPDSGNAQTSTSDTSSAMLSVVPPSMPGPTSATSPKRPKLSLQTNALPITFGKSTTALSLSLNLPTSSPTVLNTFNNAYELPRRGTPTSPAHSNSVTRQRPIPRVTNEQPYQLPLGLRGILRNSPIPTPPRRASLSAPSSSHRFFPAPKKVSYRFPLDEEIRTVRYIVPHSDLSSDEEFRSDSDAPSTPSSQTSSSDSSSEDEQHMKEQSGSNVQKKRKNGGKRQAQAEVDLRWESKDREDGPATPVQGRRKRQREWRWTLRPLNEEHTGDKGCTGSEGEDERVKEVDVDDTMSKMKRPATPEIPLPDVTETEIVELDEKYYDRLEETKNQPVGKTYDVEAEDEEKGVAVARPSAETMRSIPEANPINIATIPSMEAKPSDFAATSLSPAV